MSESKTYVFGQDSAGGNAGIVSLLAPLLQRNGIDATTLLAMNGGGGFGGWGGGSFMWLLFLLFFGGMNGGWGGFGGGGMLANQLNNDAGRDLLMQAIGGNGDYRNSSGNYRDSEDWEERERRMEERRGGYRRGRY